MTIAPSPYDIIRAIQDQQAVQQASFRATERLVLMLAGMLDKSAPDPMWDIGPLPDRATIVEAPGGAPPVPKMDFDAEPAPKTKRDRRKNGESARPPFIVSYGGVDIRTTERRALLLNTLRIKPMTLTELARARVAPTVDGVKAQVIDLNRDLKKAGVALKVESVPGKQRVGARGGREPSHYRLVSPMGSPTSAPEAAAEEATPEQKADTPASEAAQPAPERPAPAIDKLAAVDGDRVYGPDGMVYVRETAARALDVLKHGDLFGFDIVAKRAKCQSAEVVRQALNIERANLASIGLDLWSDKINVRLREIA